MTKSIKFAIVFFIFAASGLFLWSQLAIKPLSTDLTLIGQGKPALVLAYENFAPSGIEAMERINRVRSDYETNLKFLVADMGTPQGQAFTERYELLDGMVIFLSADGQPVSISTVPVSESELRRRLDQDLGRAGI